VYSNCYVIAVPRWYTLIHNIPPRPLYLRAKIRQRLEAVGAVPLKNSVYILPANAETLEDFQWIAEEVVSGGGDAHVLETAFLAPDVEQDVVARFHAARNADYDKVLGDIRAAADAAQLIRLSKRVEEIRRIDHLNASKRAAVEKAMAALERRLHRRKEKPMATQHSELRGKTWVTRPGIKVDRIASAWFIRRFIDPKARFRFVDPASARKNGELRFDMVGGDFSHEEDRCTFETLVRRVGLPDPGVQALAEIVHDLDVKDARYGRPETAGVQRMIEGIVARHESDTDRLDRGLALLDDLHHALQQPRRKPSR